MKDGELVRDAFIVNLCGVAALSWVVYDFLLCFEQEVSLVWGRWCEPKGRHNRRLYIIVRYFSIINLIWWVGVNMSTDVTQNFCKSYHYLVVVAATVITLLPDVMILIRINSVYDWNITPLLITISLFVVQAVTSLIVGFVAVSNIRPPGPRHGPVSLELRSRIPGCLAGTIRHSEMTLGAWIPSIAAQCVYLILMLNTLTHVMQGLDENGKASIESFVQVKRLVPTMMIFMKHGLWYFFVGTSMKVACAVIMTTNHGPLQELGIPILLAVYPVLITRIYLDMIAYLYTRKQSHRLEVTNRADDPNTEDGDDAEVIRFSYHSDEPKTGLGQITFAKRTSESVRRDFEGHSSMGGHEERGGAMMGLPGHGYTRTAWYTEPRNLFNNDDF